MAQYDPLLGLDGLASFIKAKESMNLVNPHHFQHNQTWLEKLVQPRRERVVHCLAGKTPTS